ncbi:MAG: SulP family inorganic anion transporter [Bacteriovoracia bacterium]
MKVLDIKDDLKSSIVVFLVALPLCLGIALASNAPLASGLIAGIIGGLVIGFLSDSHISVSGPAAGLTVIVINGIATLGSFETFGFAVMLAGLFQLVFALLKGGAIGDYFPTSVIKGMLAAIGLILIIKQFPNAFSAEMWGLNLISLLSLAIILLWEKLGPKLIPGPLIAVIVSVVLNESFHLVGSEYLVQLPEKIFTGMKDVRSLELSFPLISVAFTLAVVASLETLLCTDAADKVDPLKRKTNKNRELLAQGCGNALSGLFGGLPLTAVIVRTSANINAGAKTKVSTIMHGLWLLLCVMLIPDILNLIPLATLACILLLTGYKLAKPVYFLEMKRRGRDQLLIFVVTIAGILLTDLLIGILIGLLVAVLFELRSPSLSCVEVVEDGKEVHVKFVKNASFFHKARIHKILNDIPEDKFVFIHGTQLVRVHVDVHELITEYQNESDRKGRKVEIK